MVTILLFLIFIAPTIQYRTEIGPVTISLMEPVVLIASILLLLPNFVKNHSLKLPHNKIFISLLIMLIWAFFTQVIFSGYIQEGLSDIRNWLIPILGFVAILSLKKNWGKWIGVYIFTVVLNSLVGIYQYITDTFYPFVDLSGTSRFSIALVNGDISLINSKYSVGLFTHPNGFAMYLVGGFMITLGVALSGKRIKEKIFLLPIFTALILTFSKTSILISLGLLLAFGFIFIKLKYPTLNWVYFPFIIFLIIGAVLVISYLPSDILSTYYWRVGLWKIAYELILHDPIILLIGGSLHNFGNIAYYPQPHNVYIYIVLLYGMPGLIILFGMIWEIIQKTIVFFHTDRLKNKIILAGLFLAIMSLFAVGLAESSLFGIEIRMFFITWMALFIGFMREKYQEQSGMNNVR